MLFVLYRYRSLHRICLDRKHNFNSVFVLDSTETPTLKQFSIFTNILSTVSDSILRVAKHPVVLQILENGEG
ncbi:hypothetical protein MUK42_36983 [Musa troglodytarum]|uniref:Uncharacterized protein n=1 Tax=Musa troglodytarum TaxID=320322 RepID=A0A9E7JC80_9LILI|nr:hypothetical protein MUK42_36983 [Musa troglodytarum]